MTTDKNNEALYRHYDNLMWQTTSILAIAVGGLFIYCHQQLAKGKLDSFLAIFGMFLTFVSIYLAVSFRELRKSFENDQIKHDRKLFQWPLYSAVFVYLQVLWFKLIWSGGSGDFKGLALLVAAVIMTLTLSVSLSEQSKNSRRW